MRYLALGWGRARGEFDGDAGGRVPVGVTHDEAPLVVILLAPPLGERFLVRIGSHSDDRTDTFCPPGAGEDRCRSRRRRNSSGIAGRSPAPHGPSEGVGRILVDEVPVRA